MSSIRNHSLLTRLTGFWRDPSIAAMLKKLCVVLLISLIASLAHFKSHAEAVNGVQVVVDEAAITRGEIESDVYMVAQEILRQYGRQPALYDQKLREAGNDAM